MLFSTRGGRSSTSYISCGKCCDMYLPTHVSHVGGNVNNNVEETSNAPAVCENYYLSHHSSQQLCLRTYSCYTAKEDHCWRSTRACLWAFNTGGTTRHCVLKLFTCLKTDRRLYRGIVGGISKPCVPHRQSRL